MATICSESVLGSARTGLIFHQNPGGNTAGRADPTWPNRAGYSIPCVIMLGSGGGRWAVAWERVALWVVQFVLCFLICIVVVTVPFVCCSVKLPLSRATSFCLFLSILLHTPAGGEGQLRGAFVAGRSHTVTHGLKFCKQSSLTNLQGQFQ